MTVVVADASPLRYLAAIGAIEVLPRLFDTVVVPEYVIQTELQAAQTPQTVKTWAAHLPEWVTIRKPLAVADLPLHRGEREAIALAEELQAFAVLLDDADARRIAAQRGLAVTGTLGLLEKASELGLINLREAVDRLLKTNFRIHRSAILQLLEREDARRQGQ